MKKFLFLLTLLISVTTIAQQGINYKALIKDANGEPLANTFMNVQFTIHSTTENGTIVYQEDHNYTTDTNGLLILSIGTDATPIIGVFNSIDWAVDLHFLNTSITYNAGTVDFGTTEFLAVPYAKHAQTATTALNAETALNVTGLEALDEGNGIGWRLKGRDPNKYGNIGLNAIDLSFSVTNGSGGATAESSTAIGSETRALGANSTAIGGATTATGEYSIAMGDNTLASGNSSTAMGTVTKALSFTETTIGSYNTDYTPNSTTSWDPSDRLFVIGNGIDFNNKSDAFTVFKNGNTQITEKLSLGTTINSHKLSVQAEADNKALRLIGNNFPGSGARLNFGDGDFVYIDEPTDDDLTIHANTILLDGLTTVNGTTTVNGATTINSLGTGLVVNSGPNNIGIFLNSVDAIGILINSTGNNGIDIQSAGIDGINISSAGGDGFQIDAAGDNGVEVNSANDNGGYFTGVTSGVHAESSTNANPDIILGGTSSSATGDDGIISSDPAYAGSDIFIRSNDAVVVQLDFDNNETGQFEIKDGNQVEVFEVDESGNVRVNGALVHASDRRLKKDIEALAYGLEEILQLQPKAYNWKDRETDHKSLGLIAQDVQLLIKEIVTEQDDAAKTLGISYTELIPVLINAIQEQQDIIANRTSRIEQLEATLSEKETALDTINTQIETITSRIENLELEKSN